ncbi:MAG: type III pantothenate kinase [Candidatus Marinimicrobia bacterium]|jgi:type III pantothenate kinase|nr:type III pantothenate kinase [Candidatus Neomarinimicrobiota bacterium]
MLLAIDIGNTNVTCGVHDKKKWVHTLRLPSTLDFWNLFSSLNEFKISRVAISSVVPALTSVYVESVRNIFHLDAHIISPDNAGIELMVDSPNEVGTDRICNVAAVKALGKLPTIVGDIGSATNYDVVDKNGAFIGGAIAPGIETAAQHLIEKAALLKETALVLPPKAIGTNTEANLQSGIMLGAVDLVDGMFQRIIYETNWKNYHIFVTGGFGKLLSPHLKTKHTLSPTLTLDGIRQLA